MIKKPPVPPKKLTPGQIEEVLLAASKRANEKVDIRGLITDVEAFDEAMKYAREWRDKENELPVEVGQ